jgi:anti-sigma factor RsiW
MSNLLGQLDNDQAVLLMYLAGELPEEDRVEVEQRLVNDPALRDAMADLAALQGSVDAQLALGDAVPLPRREAAVRRVVRAMATAQDQRLAREADAALAAEPPRAYRLGWWAYPAAAAALLLVGIMIMSKVTPSKLEPTEETQRLVQAIEAQAPIPRILDQTEDPALERLEVVERQLLSLHTPDDDGLFQVELDPDR